MEIDELKTKLTGKTPVEQLEILSRTFAGKIIFTTSFGLEDQAITHMIFDNGIPVEVATLDTGRLFSQTYKVFNETFKKYNKEIHTFFPDNEAVEKMVTEKGPFSFYQSKENRLECCSLRKVIPLTRALKGKECWISGIRADQSENRQNLDWIEYDSNKKIFKFYPLFNWSFEEVQTFVKENNIPYNILHDQGFVSIGCEPCTRAVKPGEDFRSGRWWWENGSEKECGLHITKDKS